MSCCQWVKLKNLTSIPVTKQQHNCNNKVFLISWWSNNEIKSIFKGAIFWKKDYTHYKVVIGPWGVRKSNGWRCVLVTAVPGELWRQLAWRRDYISTFILVAYLHTSASQLIPSSTSWVLQVRGRKRYLEITAKLETLCSCLRKAQACKHMHTYKCREKGFSFKWRKLPCLPL